MRARQSLWTAQRGWTGKSEGKADLLLAFGGTAAVTDKSRWDDVLRRHPGAIVLGCSTGGEIHGADVLDESLSLTSLSFDRTRLKCAEAAVDDASRSFDAGKRRGQSRAAHDLITILVLSDGTRVNGSGLIRGVRAHTGNKV